MDPARAFLVLAAALVLSLLAPTALSGQPCDGEWPTFQGDNRRSGVCGTVEGPGTGEVLWSALASGNGIDTTPAVVNGVVYFGDSDGYLYAVDADTGTLEWRTENVSGTVSSPAVANGVVVIGSEHGTLSALDAASGRILWQYQTRSDVITGTPAVANGIVYVGAEDNRLYALDAGSGRERWVFEPDTRRNAWMGSPVVQEDLVFVTSNDRRVYALGASSGSLIWSFLSGPREWSDRFTSSPSADEDRVIAVTNTGAVWAIDLQSGEALWTATIRGPIASTPTLGPDAVYLSTIRGEIFALDPGDGSLLWDTPFDHEGFDTSLALVGPFLFASGGYGTVYALNAATGEVLWQQSSAGGSSSSPVVADGVLYIGSEGFGASALDALDAGIGGAPVEPNVTDVRNSKARWVEDSKRSSTSIIEAGIAFSIAGFASLRLRTRR